MSEGMIWLRRLTEILFGLALLGGAFALWSRSKGAALCGAAAGALLIFFQIVSFVLDSVFRSGSLSMPTIRIVSSLTFGFGTVLHYALLITLVVLVTRKAAT